MSGCHILHFGNNAISFVVKKKKNEIVQHEWLHRKNASFLNIGSSSCVISTEMKSNRNQMLFRHRCGTRPRRIELNQLNDGNATNVNKQHSQKKRRKYYFKIEKKLKMARGGSQRPPRYTCDGINKLKYKNFSPSRLLVLFLSEKKLNEISNRIVCTGGVSR